MILLVLVPILLVCGYVLWYLQWARAWQVDTKVPSYDGALPIIGHCHILMKNNLWNLIVRLSEEANKRDGVMRAWLGPIPYYCLTNPDVALKLSNTCLQKHYIYKFSSSWIGDGLVTVSDESTWRRHRKLLQPTFNQQILDGFLEVFNRQAEILVDRFSKHVQNGEFNHFPYFFEISLETVWKTIFGISEDNHDDIDEEYKAAVTKSYELHIQRFMKVWLHSKSIYEYSSIKKQEDEAVKILKNMSSNVIQRKRAAFQNGTTVNEPKKENTGSKYKTFLEHLLALGEAGSLSEQEVREEVDTMIIAAYDTVATTLGFTLVTLGSYPDVQRKVFEEMIDVLGDREIVKEDMNKLVYTEAVIKETLRIYPTAPIIGRTTTKDVNIDDKYTIPKGCGVIFSIYGINRNPTYWGKDADIFRPERWMEAGGVPSNAGAFAAFGLGRRSCIGKTYAMMFMKSVLTQFLRRFIIKADDSNIQLKFEVFLKPASGHCISIAERNKL